MKSKTVVYAFCQQKGGTGKTTTAHAIGAALVNAGRRVLFVDLDAQRNLTFALDCLNKERKKTICDVLKGKAALSDAVIDCETGGKAFGVVPAVDALATLHLDAPGWQGALKNAVSALNGAYDAIILDTPPALGQVLVCALMACNRVVIPALAEFFSLQGVVQVLESVKAAKSVNSDLKKVGIVITKHNARRVLSKEITEHIERIAKMSKVTVFSTRVRDCVSLAEAAMQRKSIFEYAPKSAGAIDYVALYAEITQ